MAEIRPFRGWRYAPHLPIEDLTSPLFDVVSERQRRVLYQNPYNSIHLSVPTGDQPARQAAETLATWQANGILIQDPVPAIYVYYQYFTLPGSAREICRKGFVAHIRLHEWQERVILRHENTIPHSVNDRTELLEATQFMASATHGLYTDTTLTLEALMDEAIRNPLYETEDYQGVRDVLARIDQPDKIRPFVERLRDKTIILADGHHRFEGSLHYWRTQKKAHPHHTGEEGYHFHMMYFTNTEGDHLRILPTHRLLSGLPDLDERQLLARLEEDFVIRPVADPFTLEEIIAGKKWSFGLLFREDAYKLRLKPEKINLLDWPFPDEVRHLDLTVMHYFIIEKAVGIPGKQQRASPHIQFDRSFSDCVSKVIRSEAQLALITQEISIEEVKRVCASGYTLPQKSTYFYPKVICGFVFSSIA